MDKILFTVSTKVSPFFTELPDAEKLTTSAERRFSASSKDNLVRVEFSKKNVCYGNIAQGRHFFYRTVNHFFETIRSFENQLDILFR
jgi:predicted transcriptional regulator